MLDQLDEKILRILLEKSEPVSSKELSLQCKISINLVRKEIALINEKVNGHGFHIESKTSIGHYIVIDDPELSNHFIERLRYLYKRNNYFLNDYSFQTHYLIRKILCSSESISIESLSTELFCSHSTLMRALGKVKDILASFDLQLVTRKGGVQIKGNEWNIRQCLIYQHKIYMLMPEKGEFKEYRFRTFFYMDDGKKTYDTVKEHLIVCLKEQAKFSIALLNIPKLVNYILLIQSRKKFAEKLVFSQEQIDEVKQTEEYNFVKQLYVGFPSSIQSAFHENDFIALTVMILSYETKNNDIMEQEKYPLYLGMTREVIQYFTEKEFYDIKIFDRIFMEELSTFLYTLHYRKKFGTYYDTEFLGAVRYKGIRTTDLCIDFARFMMKKYEIHLNRQDTLCTFYIYHRICLMSKNYYYSPKILIISRYGIAYAESLKVNIIQGYGNEIKSIQTKEFCEVRTDDFFDCDLIITDINKEKLAELCLYNIPSIQVDFSLGDQKCSPLEAYFEMVKQENEIQALKTECFEKCHFRDKEDVFSYVGKQYSNNRLSPELIKRHLIENDTFIDLERKNGMVFLPILLEISTESKIKVFINDIPIIWNRKQCRIFICYNRGKSWKEKQVINNILKRIMNLPLEKIETLMNVPCTNALSVIYSKV